MIRFTVWKTAHHYKGFQSSGHAEYGDGEYDLVCCGVSALAINTVNSVESFTEDVFELEQSQDGGYLKLYFPGSVSERTDLLMDSLVLGIRNIRDEYGEEYITLRIEEV
ncbi:MAG TPA: ribosomal-processing cysteine protease Prp [Candidatus Choladousia intestinavium]|uniref:Ribosomal processing cysteine protease Prp n=1 Tax=Candidatus Choladousia intestinavium TaxID=2840727 RepID=A0A9D1AEP2_9FIRM|nr:ribosomal-processing cysteine protease Prp [Candidatus Choladousia intestinavium]